MANLRNLNKAINGPLQTPVTVGHNRTIEHVGQGQHDCRLHGHRIAVITLTPEGIAKVTLDTCGYMTNTTRSAMNDFLQAFRIKAAVSFAKGTFSVRYADTDGDRQTFTAPSDINQIIFMPPSWELAQ